MKKVLLTIIYSVLFWGCDQYDAKEERNRDATRESSSLTSDTNLDLLQQVNIHKSTPPSSPSATVVVANGSLRGLQTSRISTFLGIPYAKPPVGSLRFKKPQPASNWSGVREATKPGSQCPQLKEGDPRNEDCLYLNIFAPNNGLNKPSASKPVMVYIHGGAFDNGSGMGFGMEDNLYTGEGLAELGDVIVVTFNYRLGAFGFLTHPALTKENISGNNGILDQILALNWVQENIGAFGGDKNNVTLFGQSAGAISVCTHVAQDNQRGLFKRAIMQSGVCNAGSLEDRYKVGREIVKKLGCESTNSVEVLSCLQNKSAEDFISAQPKMVYEDYADKSGYKLPFGPVIDGVLYDKDPLEILKRGQGQNVDMIIGATQNEVPGILYLGKIKNLKDLKDYLTRSGFKNSEINSLLALYPLRNHLTYGNIAAAITTDVQFTCPQMEITNTLLQSGSNKVYNYRFDLSPIPLVGAFHGVELIYLFQKLPFSAKMQQMGQLWTSYARNGVPKTGSYSWTPARSSALARNHLVFNFSPLHQTISDRQLACSVILNSDVRTQN